MPQMVAQAVREFKSDDGHVSLTDTRRIRYEFQLKPQQPATSTPLCPFESLVTKGGSQLPLPREHSDPGFFLEPHRLMSLGWALAGAGLVESKIQCDQDKKCPKQVRQCHFRDALGYRWFVET
ncbi:unnamed protein product [Prorocentrum cordatum]|uniref:Uncharacterized protein n=1 Tax=Prorocentrum cordatum TaxID=2364126 RepID=A0ABN9UMK5_9DINO|nr:unnamed protein product [Polarella glacialis]